MARHKHVHWRESEPKSKLRKLAVPIALFCIFIYAAQWAFRFPKRNPINLAAGIIFAGAAAFLWILKPRKNRHKG
jgi:O-antigen ligase